MTDVKQHRNAMRTRTLGVVALLSLLIATIVGVAGPASGSQGGDGPNASASAIGKKKFKKLRKRVEALEAKPSPVTLPPSGPAGGNLRGSYPNPGLKAIVTRGNSVELGSGAAKEVTANCNPGERIISGGGIIVGILPAVTIPLTRSVKSGTQSNPGNGWNVAANNQTTASATLLAQAYCLQG